MKTQKICLYQHNKSLHNTHLHTTVTGQQPLTTAALPFFNDKNTTQWK